MADRETPRLSFNQFQKELRDRNIDPQVAYMLTMMYEQLGDLAVQMDETLKVILSLAQSMSALSNLNVANQHAVRSLQKRVNGSDDMVQSVANDPNDPKTN